METLGSLIDKISINELKIYHMKEQLNRCDITEEQREDFKFRLSVLSMQRSDLTNELEHLEEDVLTGKVKFKVYRQMKMYNDKQFKD